MSSEPEPPPRPQSHHRSRKISGNTVTSNNLRETLAALGDDVIKCNDGNYIPNEENENSIVNLQNKPIQFQRVPSSEVGVRSARWRKAILAGLLISTSQSSKKQNLQDSAINVEEAEEISNNSGPPFWGVSPKIRNKISILSLQLILHELACFTSCVLLGCLIVQILHGESGNFGEQHWIFDRIYGSIATFLLVLSSLGFLLRIDTSDSSSLLTSPFLLLPTILMVVSVYLVKTWGLQKEECLRYLNLSIEAKKRVHLTQNCDFYSHSPNEYYRNEMFGDVVLLIMKIIPFIACLCICSYMFVFRNKFYLIEKFRR